ncbi:cytosolic phospholipase A2-like [Styela clava]
MDADIEKWGELDAKWNTSFGEIPISHKKPTILRIKVISGNNINRNNIHDYVRYPNPRIEVEYTKARGTKIFWTSSKPGTFNPEWNESFRIVLPDIEDGKSNDSGIIKFRLLANGYIFSNVCVAETDFNPDSIKIGGSFDGDISFGKMGKIKIKVTKKQKTHLRISHALCDAEMRIRKKRVPKVMRAMQKLLGNEGAPQNIFETPIISIVGSGGGIRAMTGMCGVMEGLHKSGILDCMMYAVGTSGSSWYLTSAYARKAMNEKDREKYHLWLRQSFTTSAIWELFKPSNMLTGRQVRNAKTEIGQPFTFVDYYGICTAIKAVGNEFATTKLSDIRSYVEPADVPYPIMNVSQVQDDNAVDQYNADCSFSAYECEIPQYGINIDMKKLNSQFYNGAMEKHLPEPDLRFILGTLGSVFGVSLKKIEGLMKEQEDDEVDGTPSSKIEESKKLEKEEPKPSMWSKLPHFLGRNGMIKRTGKILNVARGFSNMQRFRVNPKSGEDDDEILDGFDEHKTVLDLVDGGILCNVAVDAILRPQRRNDILIIADFTGYDAEVNFETLKSAIDLAQEGGYKFPPVDLKKIKREAVQQFYIFEDENDPECPIVFWFMTTTKKFSQLKDYTPKHPEVLKDLPPGKRFNEFSVYNSDTYDTFDLKYTNLEFDRFCELMAFNVSSNAELIKQKIRERTEQKRKLNRESF